MRKMQSPTCVTLGFVDEGEIMGTPAAWQIGAPASERDDATSPITAMTRSWLMSFCTAVAASCAWDWSSSTTTRTGSPPILPCAWLVSSAIADSTPSLVEPPNVASPPVSEPNSPMTSSSLPLPPQPAAITEAARARKTSDVPWRSFIGVPPVRSAGLPANVILRLARPRTRVDALRMSVDKHGEVARPHPAPQARVAAAFARVLRSAACGPRTQGSAVSHGRVRSPPVRWRRARWA
jgi:hypothetical protein